MTSNETSTFAENLRDAARISIEGAPLLVDNNDLDHWSQATSKIAEIASKLYGEDVEGKREFLAQVLGVLPVQAATEQPTS